MTIHPLNKVAPAGVPTALSCQDGTGVCNKIRLQASDTNEGRIWIGTSAAMNPDTGVDIYGFVLPGGVEFLGDERDGNTFRPRAWFVLNEPPYPADFAMGAAIAR